MKRLLPLLFATIILFSASPTFAQHCNVKKGDSMWIIAKRYKVDFREVLRLNKHYHNPSLIHPRDKVELPDGSTGETTTKTTDETEYAQEVLDLVNKERSKAGVPALTLDKQLTNVANIKAADMRDNNYFSHESRTYGSPFDMLKRFGINYTSAGENIAAGQKTPQEVMNSWLNSSGHRANILNANYKKLGVGYVTGGSYGTYWVQEFTS